MGGGGTDGREGAGLTKENGMDPHTDSLILKLDK